MNQGHSCGAQRLLDVLRLRGCELFYPPIDQRHVDMDHAWRGCLAMDPHPQVTGLRSHGDHLSGGDQCLAGHAVGQNSRPADPRGVNQGHLGA
ncbi:unannotated protein [freshwater metagenome]|uniref:Unannotated protein n=1 Tax=freshwater metagenome TaxID=449393 RepID=A0A6J6HTJ7_9ZZZZ